MTDLTQFGVDVGPPAGDDEDETERQEAPGPNYARNGRCPAINSGDRHRCRSPVSRMNHADGFCPVHGRELYPWTIHDDPETLILLTGEIDALSLDEVDPDDVDFDLERIRTAVHAVVEKYSWLDREADR